MREFVGVSVRKSETIEGLRVARLQWLWLIIRRRRVRACNSTIFLSRRFHGPFIFRTNELNETPVEVP